MEQLFELLKTLYLIRFYAKDIHYNAKGESFWSDHLLADEVFDGIDDFIDQVNENLFLGFEKSAPKSKDILALVVENMPPMPTDINQAWKNLYNLINDVINIVGTIENQFDIPALNALLESIVDNIQKKRGLIWRRKLSI